MKSTMLPLPTTEAGRATLVVSSLEEALDFWVTVLGFHVVSREWHHGPSARSGWGLEGAEVSSVVVEAPGQTIELLADHLPPEGRPTNPRDARTLHLAFSADDLDVVLHRIEQSRWRIVGAIQTARDGDCPGGLLTYLRGPDRITIELARRSRRLGRLDDVGNAMTMVETMRGRQP